MSGIAYAIIPLEFASLQAALNEALRPFCRGGGDQFPREKVAFDDVTDDPQQLHVAGLSMTHENGLSLWWEGSPPLDESGFDFDALRDLVLSHGLTWSRRLADIEPDFHAFVRRFSGWKDRDPETGGYGQWLNPLGRWDWWELGGRLDGVVSGERRNGMVPARRSPRPASEASAGLFRKAALAPYAKVPRRGRIAVGQYASPSRFRSARRDNSCRHTLRRRV